MADQQPPAILSICNTMGTQDRHCFAIFYTSSNQPIQVLLISYRTLHEWCNQLCKHFDYISSIFRFLFEVAAKLKWGKWVVVVDMVLVPIWKDSKRVFMAHIYNLYELGFCVSLWWQIIIQAYMTWSINYKSILFFVFLFVEDLTIAILVGVAFKPIQKSYSIANLNCNVCHNKIFFQDFAVLSKCLSNQWKQKKQTLHSLQTHALNV